MKYQGKWCLIVLVVGALGCAPRLMFKVEPVASEINWSYGVAYQTIEKDSLQVIAAFNGYVNNMMRFDVEIVNLASERRLVDPGRFFYRAITNFEGAPLKKSYAAYNPEERIAALQDDLNTQYTQEGIEAFFVLLGVTLETIAAFSDDHVHNDECEHDDYSWEFEGQREDIDRINERKDVWEFETVRKTTLEMNNSMEGYVFFPMDKSVNDLQLVFPIESTEVEMDFKQSKMRYYARQ